MGLSVQTHSVLLPVGPSGGVFGLDVRAWPFHRHCQMTCPRCGPSFRSQLDLGVPPLPHILDSTAGVVCFRSER